MTVCGGCPPTSGLQRPFRCETSMLHVALLPCPCVTSSLPHRGARPPDSATAAHPNIWVRSLNLQPHAAAIKDLGALGALGLALGADCRGNSQCQGALSSPAVAFSTSAMTSGCSGALPGSDPGYGPDTEFGGARLVVVTTINASHSLTCSPSPLSLSLILSTTAPPPPDETWTAGRRNLTSHTSHHTAHPNISSPPHPSHSRPQHH